MDPNVPPSFQPQRLKHRDMEIVTGPHMRKMPNDVQEEIRAQRREQAARFDPLGKRMASRAKLYALGGSLGLVFFNVMFTPIGLKLFPLQLLIGAVYGVVVAYLRPTGGLAVSLTIATGIVCMVVAGHTSFLSFAGLLTIVFYGFLGAFVGLGEAGRLADGA